VEVYGCHEGKAPCILAFGMTASSRGAGNYQIEGGSGDEQNGRIMHLWKGLEASTDVRFVEGGAVSGFEMS